MKIIDYRIGTMNIPLNKPFITSLRRVDSVESIILIVETDNGLCGYGSSAETKVITGDTKASIIEAIHVILDEIKSMELESYNFVFQKINEAIIGNPSAKATVDMAIYDLLSKALKMPLYQYLGGKSQLIHSDMTISMQDPEIMVQDSIEAYEAGFKSLKIKLGENIQKDYIRIAHIFKRLGNHVSYRIDANQGWSPKDSVKIIKELDELGVNVELIEQPVHYKDFEGLKYVTDRVNVPILADESVFSFNEAVRIIENRAADLINIKLMKTGGIYNAIAISRLAQEKRITCMIGSMMESPISINAALNFALAYQNVKLFDLDVPSMYDYSDFKTKYKYGAVINPSDEWGLGITSIDEDKFKIIKK